MIPASAYRGALASCALAEVHSKTMSGSWSWASNQSTPSGLASRPIAAARRRPSLVGSTPIMYRGSMAWLRRISLNMRSVPMLPGPTIAAMPAASCGHDCSLANRAVTLPSPANVAVKVSPGSTVAMGVTEPGRTT